VDVYLFAGRREAGIGLADRVAAVIPAGTDVIVLGLPRGGVPVAFEVARRLDAPLDAFGVRKLGAPGQPEFALGAIATGGTRVVNRAAMRRLGLAPSELDALAERESLELARREHAYRDDRPAPEFAARTVVVVDDGLATGATMVAAVRALRAAGAARIVAAAPVGSPEACAAVRPEVDELVCPQVPDDFMAVGLFYRDFDPPSDDEVRRLLAGSGSRAGS
jgi:predicted phosphoribosyltransferase